MQSKDRYSREEFVAAAVKSGYCSKKSAKQYTDNHPKDFFTDDDFVEVHRETFCWSGSHSAKLRDTLGINGKTTAFSNGIKGNSSEYQDWEP